MSSNVVDATERLARRITERIRQLEATGAPWEVLVQLARQVEQLVKARRLR